MKSKWINDDGSRKVCYEEGCSAPVKVSGLCANHYQRAYRAGGRERFYAWNNPDGSRMVCAQLDCDRKVLAKALCDLHYRRMMRGKGPREPRKTKWNNPDGSRMECKVDTCKSPVFVKGFCTAHYHGNHRIGTIREAKPLPLCPNGCGRTMSGRSQLCGVCNQARWRYSIPVEKFIKMHRTENKKCSNRACGSTERLHIDHDHSCCDVGAFKQKHKVSCGQCVRGWLCQRCNLALGYLKDDLDVFNGLALYLEESKNPDSSK